MMNTIFASAVVVWSAPDAAGLDPGILKIALLAMAAKAVGALRGEALRGTFSEAAKLTAGT